MELRPGGPRVLGYIGDETAAGRSYTRPLSGSPAALPP